MKTKKISKNQSTEEIQSPLAWWGKTQEKSLTLAKWMAFYEAVNIIADKAEERNIPFEDVKLCPLDIRDYINSTQDIFLRKLLEEDYKIQIYHSEESTADFLEVNIA